MSWHDTITSILNSTSSNLHDKRNLSSNMSPALLRKTLSSTYSASRLSTTQTAQSPANSEWATRTIPSTSHNPSSTADLRLAECTSHLERLYEHFDSHQSSMDTELEAIRHLIHDSVTNLRTEFSPLKSVVLDSSEISRLSREVQNLNSRMDSLSKTVTSSLSQLSNLSSRFSHGDLPALGPLRDEIAQLNEKVISRSSELETRQERVENQVEKLSEVDSRIEQTVEVLRSQLTDELGSCYESFNTRITKEVDDLNGFITENLSRFEENLAKNNSDQVELTSNIHDVRGKLNTLESDSTQNVENLYRLMEKNQFEVKENLQDLNSSVQNITHLSQEIKRLESEFKQSQSDFELFQSSVSDKLNVNQTLDQISKRIDGHDNLLSQLSERIANPPDTFSSIIKRINNLSSEVEGIKRSDDQFDYQSDHNQSREHFKPSNIQSNIQSSSDPSIDEDVTDNSKPIKSFNHNDNDDVSSSKSTKNSELGEEFSLDHFGGGSNSDVNTISESDSSINQNDNQEINQLVEDDVESVKNSPERPTSPVTESDSFNDSLEQLEFSKEKKKEKELVDKDSEVQHSSNQNEDPNDLSIDSIFDKSFSSLDSSFEDEKLTKFKENPNDDVAHDQKETKVKENPNDDVAHDQKETKVKENPNDDVAHDQNDSENDWLDEALKDFSDSSLEVSMDVKPSPREQIKTTSSGQKDHVTEPKKSALSEFDLSDISDISFSLSPNKKTKSDSDSDFETKSEPNNFKFNFNSLNKTTRIKDPDPPTPLRTAPFAIPKATDFSDDELDNLQDLDDESSFDFD
ncbi:hypothetical protein P9112_011428 [Eukaryota sp. TZLM1-RC]